MKRTLLFLLLFVIVKGFSQTNVSGNISSNTTWTKAGNPYILVGNVGVPSAYTLTIEAGVRIERYADNQILINGALQMEGTEADSIILFSSYASSVETKSFIEFAKSNLDKSSLRFVTFLISGNQAGNIRVGNEQPNSQTNPKNSGTLLISRSSLSNGFTFAAGYKAALGVTIDSCYIGSGQLINNRNDSSEPITITNSTLIGCEELTGSGDNRINHFNCTLQNCNLLCPFGVGAANFSFDSCRVTNTPVTGFNGSESISFLRSVNINSPFAVGSNIKISHSDFTVNSDANFSQFSTDANNQPIFIVGKTLSSDSSTYNGLSNVTNLYVNGYSGSPYADTIVHNSFTGFKSNLVVVGFSSLGITVDYNNFLHSSAATVYDISNLSTVDFYARYNYFDLNNGKTIEDYIYDTNDDLSVGLVIIEDSSSGVLPVHLVSLSGFYKNSQITLQWQTSNEFNMSSFVVQHLENNNYSDAGSVTAIGNVNSNYTFTTGRVNEGKNIYRLKMIDKDGKISFSSSIDIEVASLPVVLIVYPNPASRYVLILHTAENKSSQLQLADINGKVIKTIPVAEGDVQNKIWFEGLAKGIYKIIWRSTSSITSKTLVIQ